MYNLLMNNQNNITFLCASWVITCDKEFTIIKNGAIIFDTNIIEVGTSENLKKKFPALKPIDCGDNSVLMPGLINSHIHLEFSANKTHLKYGNFMEWLYSVIENREELIEKATKDLIDTELTNMLKTGTTSIGAISSYGFDMASCVNSPLNVVYFTEVIGSKSDMIDTLYTDFKAKLHDAKINTNENFTPAVAIHSPYSVHPFLIREVLNIAKDENLCVSAHFQESKGENNWLNHSNGEFAEFFKNFLQQTKSTGNPIEFLQLFKNINNLSFTHCVEANKAELQYIKNLNASIIHCPNSNRILNNSKLNLKYINDINLSIGTDGLSSNNSLSMFDELRVALSIHNDININDLSKQLLINATSNGAKTLGLNSGSLKKSRNADIIQFILPDEIQNENDLATHIILHTKKVAKTYIKGKEIELI